MWQTVRQNYKLPLFLGIGVSVVAVLFSALFNKFSDQLSPFVNMMPAGMKAVVGDLAIGTTPEGWLSIELFPLVAMVGVVITAIILGAGVIGREEDSGTLELLLASRRTRVTIVLQKYAAIAGLLIDSSSSNSDSRNSFGWYSAINETNSVASPLTVNSYSSPRC